MERPLRGPLVQRADHEREREEEVQRDHPAGRGGGGGREQEEGSDEHEARHDHGLDDRLEIGLVDEPPQLRVEAESRKEEQLHHHHKADRLEQQVLVATGNPGVEAQHEREVVGERDQACVDGHLAYAAYRNG